MVNRPPKRATIPKRFAKTGHPTAPMPSLIRLLIVLAILAGLAYGAMLALVTFVDPKPREITITVPPDRLGKPR